MGKVIVGGKTLRTMRRNEEQKADARASYEEWIGWASDLFAYGAEHRDQESTEIAANLVSSILQVHQLYHAFRQSPRRNVDGPRGVAEKLGLSRQGVYLRLRMVGLGVAELIEPEATFEDLVRRSPRVKELVEVIERKMTKFEIPRRRKQSLERV
jgi:hypothetical protein